MRGFSMPDQALVPEKEYKTYTYAMTQERILGFVDGLAAVKQAVYKILNTERSEYPVYGPLYGLELKKLIGKERPYVQAELKRNLTEALSQDDRIKKVSGFVIGFEGDICRCSFQVTSIYGQIESNVEVNI